MVNSAKGSAKSPLVQDADYRKRYGFSDKFKYTFKTKKGIEEVVHQIDGDAVTITSCQHEVVKKMRPVKADGGSRRLRAHR